MYQSSNKLAKTIQNKLHQTYVNNQLDALFLLYLFHFCTCFEQPSAHHQENQFYQYIIWYISFCIGDCLVCRSGGNTKQSHMQSDIYQMMYLYI
jgi:hypothetical protein